MTGCLLHLLTSGIDTTLTKAAAVAFPLLVVADIGAFEA
jgi:hypothetical protein